MAKSDPSKSPGDSKHDRPKIMLLDCPKDVAEQLRLLHYTNVMTGSFGKRYDVPNDGGMRPAVPLDFSAKGLPEQEVVVIDLTQVPEGPAPDFNSVGVNEPELWVHCTSTKL